MHGLVQLWKGIYPSYMAQYRRRTLRIRQRALSYGHPICHGHPVYVTACTCDWSVDPEHCKWIETATQCSNIIALLVPRNLRLLPRAWGPGARRRNVLPVWPIPNSCISVPSFACGDIGHSDTMKERTTEKHSKGRETESQHRPSSNSNISPTRLYKISV
jgi:hypothetical protein